MVGGMKKKLFFAAALVSLLLCAGCVWWWVGSSGKMAHFSWQGRGGSTVHLMGSDGKVMLTRTVADGDVSDGRITWGSMPSGKEPQLEWTSFTYSTRPSPSKSGGIES